MVSARWCFRLRTGAGFARKNLAGAAGCRRSGLLLLALISAGLRLSPLLVITALFQIATMLFIAGLCGNLLSILVPYRIQSGSMKPTKVPGLAMLTMCSASSFARLAMFPVFVPPLAEFLLRFGGLSRAVPGKSFPLGGACRVDGVCLLADA